MIHHDQDVYTTLIFDLGDVLFTWSSETNTSISSKSLRQALESSTWHQYEQGLITEQTCYSLVGQQLSVQPEVIAAAFAAARDSLKADHRVVALIHSFRNLDPHLKVYAMSNISAPDYEALRTKSADWSIFDHVFTSASAGSRKPDLGFYRHIIAETGCTPDKTIFIDDKLDNIISARSFGMQGVLFDTFSSVARRLNNLLGDSVARGQAYLRENAGHMMSSTESGAIIRENFAQVLILMVTGNRELVNLVRAPRLCNFFQGHGEFTTASFPPDLDTTALTLDVTSHADVELVHSVLTEMLEYRNADGIVQVYFDHSRPRIDPVVSVNVLTLFYKHGRGKELKETLAWVYDVLVHRAYLDGTRYYATAETFLYFVNRLVHSPNFVDDRPWKALLKLRVQERKGMDSDALALAMRVFVCTSCDVNAKVDLERLALMQCEDGGWEGGWIYKYGSSGMQICNRGLTTAVVVQAILAMRALEKSQSSAPAKKGW